MGSILISDFKFGLDKRRQRVAGIPGTLWNAKNVQISRGGDIERPKRFVPTYTLPAGATFGLGAVGGQIYVFGSAASPVGLPNGVQYQRLQSPAADAMTQVIDVKAAGGSLYVIAKYASGDIYHFYNGARVTDWDALAATNGTVATLTQYLADVVNADANVTAVAAGQVITVTANTPGTAFTVAQSVGGGHGGTITLATLQANVPAVAETVATGTVTITAGAALNGINQVVDITINGVSTLRAPANWVSSNAATANAVAIQVNNKTATTGYSALAVGAVVTISAKPGTGATPNGFAVTPVVAGSVTASSTPMAGGVTAVTAIAQISTATLGGSFNAADPYTLTINGTGYVATAHASGTGKSLYVQKKRMWSSATSLEQYCALNTFTDWSTATPSSGAGFLNLANDAEGSEPLVGAGTYITQTAIFSRRNCRIYNLNTDATAINLAQAIDNTGALSARSIVAYGTTDLFYLDETGIRSLKARDASGAAFVNDLGTAIDPFVRTNMNALPQGTIQRACAVVEPIDGRFWLAIGPFIYVLSYFLGSQISAWTYFDPGFTVTDFARAYNKLYVRAGDTIYLYGGANGNAYPNAGEMVAQVDLPFVATQPPGLHMLDSFDIACTNTWDIFALTDPNNENALVDVGNPSGVTYAMEHAGLPGRFAHVALTMSCSQAGAATISNITFRHDGEEPTQ